MSEEKKNRQSIQLENSTSFEKGMSLQRDLIKQPKGTYRYALNTINQDGSLVNEESNIPCGNLPQGFIPIGKCYISDEETVLFLVNPDTDVSEIGVYKDCKYTTHVNDEESPVEDRLNFKVTHQIQATYRLRRGCDKTLYFTDNLNPPRYFNLSNPDLFKKDGLWKNLKFNIFRESLKQPDIKTLQVLDSFGSLKPGSYTILVQYLDEDLNPTQFYELASNIYIYNDYLDSKYEDIEGSIRLGGFKIDAGEQVPEELKAYTDDNTSKAIEIDIENVDYNFPYIRYAIVEYTNSTGQPTGVFYSDTIPVKNSKFIYTGTNATTRGTIEEVSLTKAVIDIEKAAHIEQIENRLILANTQSKQVKQHILQKYASKIQTDCVVKEVDLNDINDPHNMKNPLLAYNGIGYQAGEVYSFGIIYYYKSGGTSPVFHIPGKSGKKGVDKKVYAKGDNLYPMSNRDNVNISSTYSINETCNKEDFWGRDCEGNLLTGSLVRHHRFPTRKELGIPLVEVKGKSGIEDKFHRIYTEIEVDDENVSEDTKTFEIKIEYTHKGILKEKSIYIDPKNPQQVDLDSIEILRSERFEDIKFFYRKENEENFTQIDFTETQKPKGTDGRDLPYFISSPIDNIITVGYYYGYTNTVSSIEEKYVGHILGVKFSNITIPKEEDLGDVIVGYQIVRLERGINDRTIIDSAIMLPVLQSGKYKSTGILSPKFLDGFPNYSPEKILSKKEALIINPEYKFKNIAPDNFSEIEEVGHYFVEKTTYDCLYIENMHEHTTTTGNDSAPTKDHDGSDLKNMIRYSRVSYQPKTRSKEPLVVKHEDTRLYSLNSIEFTTSYDEKSEIYNLAQDNSALIISSKEDKFDFDKTKYRYPYVLLKSNNKNFYQNFRNSPYQIISNTIFSNTEETTPLFGGDCYISPMRYTNHIYCNFVSRFVAVRQSFGEILKSIVTIGLGIAAFFIPGLQGLTATLVAIGAGALVAGGGLMLTSSFVKTNELNNFYQDKWKAGLETATMDWDYQKWFVDSDPLKYNSYALRKEDTFRWMTDIIGDIWFESQYNISLRSSSKNFAWSYLKPLKPAMQTNHHNVNQVNIVGRYKRHKGFIGIGKKHVWALAPGHTTELNTPELSFAFHKILRNKQNTGEKGIKYDYFGISIPQVYILNADYNLNSKVRKYYQLPLTYDFCSDCTEKFPHRVHYSEQSFQEEKTDNYRTFLPNNYRDIEGETGEITNIFRLNNDLFVHTREALWKQPRAYQERVTDQIVSFIGTGSYFEIPPQKLIDDETGHSAGTQHKWSSLKTPAGYFFVSELQKNIYQFNGQTPLPISSVGISEWFEENLKTNKDGNYITDNPSNILGTGYISTYDTDKERVIFTKRNHNIDLTKLNIPLDTTYIDLNNKVIFRDYKKIIEKYTSQGYTYKGIKNSKMVFEREVLKTRKEVKKESIFKDVDYILFRYNFNFSNGRDLDTRTTLKQPFESRQYGWNRTSNEEGINLSKYIKWAGDNTGYGREVILLDLKSLKEDYPDNPEIIMECRAFWYGEKENGNMNIDAEAYKGGIPIHTGWDLGSPNSFEFIIQGGELQGKYSFPTVHIPTHRSHNIDGDEVGKFIYTIKDGNLEWVGRGSGGNTAPTTRDVEVIVEYYEDEKLEINGEKIDYNIFKDLIEDDSWTVSYSLENKNWISFHSYKPNFYIHTPHKFYSWKYDIDNNSIWKHNKEGFYQNYYNKQYPHIIEYISLSTPLVTRIWNHIRLNTESYTLQEDSTYSDNRYVTFNKALFYNSRQCSGELNLEVKNNVQDSPEYLWGQVSNQANTSVIDRTEKDWFINDFRDYKIDYTKANWKEDIYYNTQNYLPEVNTDVISYNKNWSELENFRDKYLGVRLIFDKFADRQLITHFSIENEQISQH